MSNVAFHGEALWACHARLVTQSINVASQNHFGINVSVLRLDSFFKSCLPSNARLLASHITDFSNQEVSANVRAKEAEMNLPKQNKKRPN